MRLELKPILVWAALLAGGSAYAAGQELYAAAKSGAYAPYGIPASKAYSDPVSGLAGPMQVEEPISAPSLNDKITDPHIRAKGLSERQKEAFRKRKEKMQEMMALIKAKRSALQNAKPEERAALARELHNLILEKNPEVALPTPAPQTSDPAGNATARETRVLPGEKPSDKAPENSGVSPGTGDSRAPLGSSAAQSAREGGWESGHRRGEERPVPKMERPREMPKHPAFRDEDN